MSQEKPKAELGIRHKVVFEIPAGCHIECKTNSHYEGQPAIVVSGSKYKPGYFFHGIGVGTFGPFDTYEKACACLPEGFGAWWEVIVPTVKVEV